MYGVSTQGIVQELEKELAVRQVGEALLKAEVVQLKKEILEAKGLEEKLIGDRKTCEVCGWLCRGGVKMQLAFFAFLLFSILTKKCVCLHFFLFLDTGEHKP